MEESLSGGTTNLLRMARSGCQSAVAFLALSLGDQMFATAMYPTSPEDSPLGADEIDDLVRQLWFDPGLGRGKALVRTVHLGGVREGTGARRLSVAAVPLGTDEEGRAWGILGVSDPDTKVFGLPELELLSRISARLASYVRARQEVRQQLAASAQGAPRVATTEGVVTEPPAAGGEGPGAPGETPDAGPADAGAWWAVEPEPAPPSSAPQAPPAAPAPTPPAPAVPAPAPPRPPSISTGRAMTDTFPARPVRSPAPEPDPAGAGGSPRPHGTGPLASPARAVPPFPPPAGTTGTPSPPRRRAPAPIDAAAATVHGAGPSHPGPGTGPADALLAEAPADLGLVPLGALLGRAGRLLGAGSAASGTLVVVALQLAPHEAARDAVLADAARALRRELRFDDPVAMVGQAGFVAVVAVVPGGPSGETVEAQLAAAVDAATGARAPSVRSAHVVAHLSGDHDADELVRRAVGKLRAT